MSEHGEFSVEHCYNKWKNLRRDIRLFSNTNSMQKLSIRNTYIMERVQRMVNEIGYEGSRKSSSPISPNFDLVQCNDNNGTVNTQMTNKEFWSAYNNLDPESRIKIDNNLCNFQNKPPELLNHVKLEKTTITATATNNQSKSQSINDPSVVNNNNNHNTTANSFNKVPIVNNNGIIENTAIEDSIISLLSDPAVSQAILMNPKLLDEILPGLDFTALMKKFADAHPELVHIPTVTVTNSHISDNCNLITNQFPNNNNTNNVSIGVAMTNNSINSNNNNNQKKHPMATNLNSTPHLSYNNDMTNSWPHQLYELLHSFRDEESRQMARLDQLVGFVQVMQESTKRRLSTINQLISLAGLLIPQK